MDKQTKKATRRALFSKKSWGRGGKKKGYKPYASRCERRAGKHLAKEELPMTPDLTQKNIKATTDLVAQAHDYLPEGVEVLTLPLAEGFDTYKRLPPVLEYQGRKYGKTGWNSDVMVGYWRTDALIVQGRNE